MTEDWKEILQARRMNFIETIEKHDSIGRAKLQGLLNWGDGVFDRTRRAVLELYPDYVVYNKRTKLFTVIKPEQEFFTEAIKQEVKN